MCRKTILERIVDETDVPGSRVMEKIIKGSCAAQAPERMELQTLRAEKLTAIHVEGVKPIADERVLSNTPKQKIAVPVPQIREEIVQKIQLSPKDRMSDRIVEQNVNISTPEEIQLVIQLIPQSRISECVSEQIVNTPIQQSPMVRKSQKTIETPQVQHMVKVADFPYVQERQTSRRPWRFWLASP